MCVLGSCAEYIFDHRGGEVEGRNFRQWFINEYMITNETLYHKNPVTGEPQVTLLPPRSEHVVDLAVLTARFVAGDRLRLA